MPDNNITDGSVFTSSFYNTNIREQVVATVTSSTRPTGVEGRMIFETDTNKYMFYDGSAWRTFGGAWTSFTPSWTNLTVGTGATNEGEYCYVPGGMHVRVSVVLGTSPTVGNVLMTIPNSETIRTGISATDHPLGHATYNDVTGNIYRGVVQVQSTTSVRLRALNASSTYAYHAQLSSTVPFTWAASDLIRLDFTIPVT